MKSNKQQILQQFIKQLARCDGYFVLSFSYKDYMENIFDNADFRYLIKYDEVKILITTSNKIDDSQLIFERFFDYELSLNAGSPVIYPINNKLLKITKLINFW